MSISKQQCEFALDVARLIAYINIKKHLKKFFTVLGLSLATIIILTFISLGIQKLIPSTVISFILSMALLAWLRMYVFTSWKST